MCVRRPREGTDRSYLIHVLSGRGRLGGAAEYETDRARFIGRGGRSSGRLRCTGKAPLSDTTGPVLDPIVSLRQAMRIPAGGTARLSFTTGFADNEEAARQLIDKYHDRRAVARALALASTHSQIELRHLGLTLGRDHACSSAWPAGCCTAIRGCASPMPCGQPRGQPELWKYGISGDLPILLVRIADGGEAGCSAIS